MGQRKKFSSEYKDRRNKIYALGEKFGAVSGFNPLMDMFDRPEAAAVNNYHLALRIDYLHTLWKGMVEYAVTFALQMVLCVSTNPDFFGVLYAGVFAELDVRIARFPTKQALQPVRLNYMTSVSGLMKAEALPGHKQGKGTGVLSGHIPGWQQPNLALQIMLAIGTKGIILPNKEYMCANGKSFNPQIVVVTALSAVLEVEFFSHARVISAGQLKTFSSCILNAKFRLIVLYDMKQNFLRELGLLKRLATPLQGNEFELPRYLKCQLMEHIPLQQIPDLGAHQEIFCTQGGEQAHHLMVQEAFRVSSKVFSSTEAEMCATNLKREHVRRLRDEHSPQLVHAPEVPEATRLTFNVCVNMGNVQLEHSLAKILSLHPSTDDSKYPRNEGIPFMHPLLTSRELLDQLETLSVEENGSSTFLRKWIKAFKSPVGCSRVAKLHLHGALACTGHVSVGIKPFLIRANHKYRGNFRTRRTESVFSSLEVRYETENYLVGEDQVDFVKVFAIVELALQSKDGSFRPSKFFLSVVRYKAYSGKKRAGALPYHMLKFECQNSRGGLGLDMLPLSCVHRPMFVVPSLDGDSVENRLNFSTIIFYYIPFKRCVKTDNTEYAEYAVHTFGGVRVFTPLSELTSANAEMGLYSKDCRGFDDEELVLSPVACVAPEDDDERSDFGDDSDQYAEVHEDITFDI